MQSLKVLTVAVSDLSGGAQKAAYRLYRALLDEGVNSQMLVQTKWSDESKILGPSSDIQKELSKIRIKPLIDMLPVFFYRKSLNKFLKPKNLFYPAWSPFNRTIKKINQINPDIVHLHWICGGMIRIEDLNKIKAPIVWSFQDMWAFTGGCHFSGTCDGYQKSCGNCPNLESKKKNDLSKKVFNRKAKTYRKIKKLTGIGVSRWMQGLAQSSTLFTNKEVINLPNCINTSLFKPIEKKIVRSMFNIPNNKKVILFGAAHPEEERKGLKELLEAINMLTLKSVVIVIAGCSSVSFSTKIKYPTYFIPPLKDETSLPMMYNTADVMIVPSLEENLSNSIIESLSCGIPVVGFDIGGNQDIIQHKKNGYLAQARSIKDLSDGITWVLKQIDKKDPSLLSISARDSVLRNFASSLVAKKYIKLYQKIIQQS